MGSQNSGSPQDNRTDRGTILVVDDSPTIRKLVDIILKKCGFRVISASNGLEALARINDGLPSMIFLDITMPRMDGYQLCKIIKANQETRDIPVVMLTSKDGLIDKVRGRMAGSTGYITKPFGPDTLLQAVEKYSNSKDN
jgi:twitching motility two-component system response regulator PilG